MNINDITLTIQTNTKLYYPIVLEDISLEMERSGSPSKLKFTVVKDDNISFGEGDVVRFYYKETPMFYGYVFSKTRNKDHHIQVTAYDQIRYLKNKFTYVFSKKTASEIIKMICDDYGLTIGHIADTEYTIPTLIKENASLLDIILEALDETLLNTGQLYILYDDFGKLTLKSIYDMVNGLLIDSETAEDFSYTSSIDNETYNQVVLYYIDKNTNTRIPYVATDNNNVQQWGLLRYFEEVKTPSIGQIKANSLLNLYNKKTRELKITGAFGHPTVRAGSLIPVQLNLGDTVVNNLMMVESITHKFTHCNYTMDITINGNWGD